MNLSTAFVVAQPIGTVWQALTDLRFVAECLPGATITDVDAHGTYAGTLAVRMGSINATFAGTARLDHVDDDERQVTLVAGGTSGLGDANLRLRGVAASVADGTRVVLETDVELSGRLAQLGHGVGARVTERLIERLAATLERRLAGEEAPVEADDLSVVDLVRAAVPESAQRYARPVTVFLLAMFVGWWVEGLRSPRRL